MKYDILADTDFIRAVKDKNEESMNAAFGSFMEQVVALSDCHEGKAATYAAFAYAEIELKKAIGSLKSGRELAEEAIEFIHEMQQMVKDMPTTEIKQTQTTSSLNWTGDIVNLVELMYGLQEMQCLNDGKLTMEELGNRIFPLFGLKPKIYSRIYIDIKQRATKNGNRTYFLSKMRNMLEERIDQDIHISLRRK
ncbi:MAG: RteC domain-containing protein [Bacteroidaceae bacterium]|nr:RteC domain-containing protein [Bacteroidaceae bacterium]